MARRVSPFPPAGSEVRRFRGEVPFDSRSHRTRYSPFPLFLRLSQIQADQDAIDIRQVADEPAQRQRQFLDQRGRRDVSFREDRLLIHIDHFKIVTSAQIFFAYFADVENGLCRAGCGAGDVQAQHVFRFVPFRRRPLHGFQLFAFPGIGFSHDSLLNCAWLTLDTIRIFQARHGYFESIRMETMIAALVVLGKAAQRLLFRRAQIQPHQDAGSLERSPMIFLIGSGSLRTRVGMARIWSPRASFGFPAGR